MRIKRKPDKWVVFIVVGLALLTICSVIALIVLPGTSGSGSGTQIEQEDCDAEDRRNREADCWFVPETTKPAAVKTTKPAANKPAPKVTRR